MRLWAYLGLVLVGVATVYVGATNYISITRGFDVMEATPDDVMSFLLAVVISAFLAVAGLYLLTRLTSR